MQPIKSIRPSSIPASSRPKTGQMSIDGQTPETGFGDLTPVSPVWRWTIDESVACTDITFQDNRPLPQEEKK